MKLLLAISCLTACLVAVSCVWCSGADDCKDGFCCIAISALTMERKGLCLRHARLGARCNKEEAKMEYYGGKFVRSCPCIEGLACEPKGLKPGVTDPVKIRESQRCQKPAATDPPTNPPSTLPPVTKEEPEPKQTTKSEPDPENTTEPEPQPEPETTTEPEPQPEPETTTEPEPQPETETTTEPESNLE